MKTAEALGQFLAKRGVVEGDAGREGLYRGTWFFVRIHGVRIPFFPMVGFRRGLAAHDTHHLVNGYETNWVGECEVAAWELASGGCGSYFAYWIDRMVFLPLGLLTAPLRTLRAFRRGLGQRNLYRLDPDAILSMEVDEVRCHLVKSSSGPR
jgi:hypothetical protein